MPTFETPEPIRVRIELGGGSIRLIATERTDTVVEVRPRDETRDSDVWAADHTRVDLRDGELKISGAKRGLPRFRGAAVDIEIAVPSRSRLHASLGSADMRAVGEFADTRFSSASGTVEIDKIMGKLKAANASGSFTVQSVEGKATATTASGAVSVGDLDGNLDFRAASGSLTVDTLRGRVRSNTASGSTTVAAAIRGAVSVHTSSGEVTVGVVEGTAVRLDIVTRSGVVNNPLQSTDGPGQGDETLALEVRSASGGVHIHRAEPALQTPVPAT